MIGRSWFVLRLMTQRLLTSSPTDSFPLFVNPGEAFARGLHPAAWARSAYSNRFAEQPASNAEKAKGPGKEVSDPVEKLYMLLLYISF